MRDEWTTIFRVVAPEGRVQVSRVSGIFYKAVDQTAFLSKDLSFGLSAIQRETVSEGSTKGADLQFPPK